MSDTYCPFCNKDVEYYTVKSERKEFKGHEVNCEQDIAHCKVCNVELFVPEVDGENIDRLFKKYEEISGNQVRRIRRCKKRSK